MRRAEGTSWGSRKLKWRVVGGGGWDGGEASEEVTAQTSARPTKENRILYTTRIHLAYALPHATVPPANDRPPPRDPSSTSHYASTPPPHSRDGRDTRWRRGLGARRGFHYYIV